MRRRTILAVATALLAAAVAGCGGSTGNAGGGDEAFVFGAVADPVALDPAQVLDQESNRVTQQIFEGLVTMKPGTADEVEPLLATSWRSNADADVWTFELRKGVTFHDGTPFDAEAVCANFDRWYDFRGVQQSEGLSLFWNAVFGGFSDGKEPSLYRGCKPLSEHEVRIELTRPSASFLAALTVSGFFIASPTALEKHEADKVSGDEEAPVFEGTFATEHPIGTGPYRLASWERGNRLELEANPDYWGDAPAVERVVFVPIGDPAARRQALEAGDIDAYDLVNPEDVETLRAGGFEVLERPGFNTGWLAMDQRIAPFDDPDIRKAVAYAVDREALVRAKFPRGAEVAHAFMPPTLFGYADDVKKYPHDPEKAREHIAASGLSGDDLTIEFSYFADASRAHTPVPQATFEAFRRDLEEVGFTVEPDQMPFSPDYVAAAFSGKTGGLYLLGRNGDYGDPSNFLNQYFGSFNEEFGFESPKLFALLERADSEPDRAKRTALYEQANRMIMADIVPGVPIAHVGTFVAVSPEWTGYQTSPVYLEPLKTVERAAG